MFNKEYRDRCINRLEDKEKKYKRVHQSMLEDANNLYLLRKDFKDTVDLSWEFLNSLRNKPTYLETQLKEIKVESSRFADLESIMSKEAKKADFKSKGSAAAGVATGVGVAALGPSVAMGVAMTFGTASTGTAIAALSGAAATNAALAWLGGGALVAGGGGMAAGNAFLALAGPVGWVIGAGGLIGAGVFSNSKNKEIAAKANEESSKLNAHIKSCKGLMQEMSLIANEITAVSKSLPMLMDICSKSELDFYKMTDLEKENISTLINNTQSGAKLLNKGIGEGE